MASSLLTAQRMKRRSSVLKQAQDGDVVELDSRVDVSNQFVNGENIDVYVDNSPSSGSVSLSFVLETLMDAVLIVDAAGKILQSNLKAVELCERLIQSDELATKYPATGHLPTVLKPLLGAIVESYETFERQSVLPEFEIYLDDRTPLRVRGQFLDIPRSNTTLPYVLITIENRQESLQSVAIGDAQRFGFTTRETEVWHLRLLGHSYREISAMLFITENTVRKHVKSILAKRRVELDALA